MTGFDTIKFIVDKTETAISSASIGVFCGAAKLQLKSFSDLGNGFYGVTVGEKFDISKAYTLKADGYGEKTIVPTGIFDTAEFAEMYHYDGNDLGAVISGDRTVFKLWAPTASKVVVNFFFKGEGGSAYKSVNASPTDKGVWTYAERCGHGTYYTYTVTTACGTQELVDPYAKAVGVNGDRGMVVDLGITDPRGWKKESFIKNIKTYSDAVIWEVHVRDFSIGIRSSKYRGKYLAFTERGLTNESGVAVGVDHLVNLGVTHVHLNPVYDFATVDEKDPSSGYNWGYDPKNYNAPKGSYSTDPFSGAVRVTELKTAVAALHKAGIGVVIDVVYNHTYESNSFLNKAVPYYYYRFDERGNFTNGSGCGNETASERYMFRKFILDSVTYWLTEYKLDGVRFDLMGLHDLKTMERIEKAVHKINPYALIYGEGWTGGPSALEDGMRASLSNVYKIPASFGASGAVAVFNDVTRDGIKGGGFDRKTRGLVNGNPSYRSIIDVCFGIAGGIKTDGVEWHTAVGNVINYDCCHDDLTIFDKLKASTGDADDRILYMAKLSAAIIFASHGVPFILAGEEFMRTKKGDGNSYKSGDDINALDWESLKPGSLNIELSAYYERLIALRKRYDFLRRGSAICKIVADAVIEVGYYTDGNLEAKALINANDRNEYVDLGGEFKKVFDGWSFVEENTSAGYINAKSLTLFIKR